MALTHVVRRAAATLLTGLLVVVGTAALHPVSASATTPSSTDVYNDNNQVRWLINRERAAHGLPALVGSQALFSAALSHNKYMAKYNALSHQLPGEMSLGSRVTYFGYRWRAVGENIGVTQDWSQSGILAIANAMYNERPPNDGHRLNILSSTYKNIGVSVYIDTAHHVAWLTEVFAAPL